MGDIRYRPHNEALGERITREAVRTRSDEELVSALAAMARRDEELRANVVASELHNRLQERLRREEAILHQEERERLLVDGSLHALLLIDNDGKVLHASAATERILGWHPADIVNRSVTDVVDERDRERILSLREHLLSDGGEATFRYRSSRRPGRWLISRARRIDLGDGHFAGTVAVVREEDEPAPATVAPAPDTPRG